MIELPLVFTSGILGSSHCIGMCGPFALAIGSESISWKANLVRQLIYSVGRIFTYTVLGATAGFAGMRLAESLPSMVNVPAMLAIFAGLFLVYQGVLATGLIQRKWKKANLPCLSGSILKSFLSGRSYRDMLLAGVFTGFLPCGLVYAFLAMAAGTANMFAGALLMAVFGMGTVPIMVATGLGGSLLSIASRKKLFHAAAWSVIIAGCLSIGRGVAFFGTDVHAAESACPFCHDGQ
ncbi:MAG: sulfite exporter TauE/SafE family protein [Planctomycetales bacterium]|nr:sulfite exporter TauE/SafE family protein [Planctomycetales bacterium]